MLTGILVTLTIIVQLAVMGLLLLLCIRTRSKGLIVMFGTYIGFMIVGAIFQPFFQQYIDQWAEGEVDNWLTERMTLGSFVAIFEMIKRFFYMNLNLIGLILVYKEWRHGKFGQSEPESIEESTSSRDQITLSVCTHHRWRGDVLNLAFPLVYRQCRALL